MKFIVSLLICFFLALATAQTIKLDVYTGSNAWWLAIAVRNAGVDTRSVQIRQSGAAVWDTAVYQNDWGYYTFSNGKQIKFPLSVQLTSTSGNVITVNNIIASTSAGVVETNIAYGGMAINPATGAPTGAPTASPPPRAATSAPLRTSTKRPAATSKPTSTRRAATTRPATDSPVESVATASPTTRVATASPTTRTATSPPSSTGCSAPMKMMVPLYTYPGASWDAVAATGRIVPTVAIINPNSGPGNGPDSSYNTYMNKLNNAGVEMVGYVHTLWGARDINVVKAEINTYATQFPLVVGIFLDEGAATDAALPYYQELYRYIMSMPGWKYDIINPGTVPTPGYVNAATQIVIFEDVHTKFSAAAAPSYASCNNKDKFAVITYGASASGMQSAVSAAKSKAYYGWFYVTDGAGGCCTYNALTSYYGAMATAVATANSN